MDNKNGGNVSILVTCHRFGLCVKSLQEILLE